MPHITSRVDAADFYYDDLLELDFEDSKQLPLIDYRHPSIGTPKFKQIRFTADKRSYDENYRSEAVNWTKKPLKSTINNMNCRVKQSKRDSVSLYMEKFNSVT